jgi:hypothetical protein
MPEELMPAEMAGEETANVTEDSSMLMQKYREGLQRILQSTNIAEIRSIAQELLQGDQAMETAELPQPSLRDKLGERYEGV